MSLEETVQFCQSIELSEKSRKEIESTAVTSGGENSATVFRANVKSINQQQQINSRGKKIWNKHVLNPKSNKSNELKHLCKKCNREHGPRNCPAYGKKCTACFKMNHFAVERMKNKNIRVVDVENSVIENNNSK